MSGNYLRRGCDNKLATEAANATKGVNIVKRMNEGSKLWAASPHTMANYDQKYEELFHKKYRFPVGYRPIADLPPEHIDVEVMWGDILGEKEFGTASRMGDNWFYRKRRNMFENDKSCATPTAWKY